MAKSLSDSLAIATISASQPDGSELLLLPLSASRRLAREFGVPLRQIELAAIEKRILPARYHRSLGTVGFEGQRKLLTATVAVIGAGGLGGWILEGLARMGIGNLVVIDADTVEENNLNRQLLATEATLGKSKASLAAARIGQVNAATEVVARQVWADASNLPDLLAGVQVAVDALDTLPARLELQRAANQVGIPLVHGAIAGYSGQVMTILPGDAGLFALYGRGPIPERGIETLVGNPAATPMMIAAWQVQEVVKLVTGRGEILRHRLLLMDAEGGDVDILHLPSDEAN